MSYLQNRRSRLYIARIALVGSLGGFLIGYDLVVIAGATPYLQEYFDLSATMKGFAVGSLFLGAMAGPLAGLWFSDKIGRRKTMMTVALLFIIAAVGCALAETIWSFTAWRFLQGISIGLAMVSSPIYIAELSPSHMRGPLVTVNAMANVISINLAVWLSYLLSFVESGWRWMYGTEAVFIAVLLAGLFFIPDSPRWLAARNRVGDALRVLTKINGQETAERGRLLSFGFRPLKLDYRF